MDNPALPTPSAWLYKGEAHFDGNNFVHETKATTHLALARLYDRNPTPLYTLEASKALETKHV